MRRRIAHGSDSPHRAVARQSLTEQLQELLRIEIVEGLLKPGERLRAAELERRYGVSATPLREALQALAAEGLVILEPNHGARVSPTSPADLYDVYLARTVIEGEALAMAVSKGSDAWLTAVTSTLDQLGRASAGLDGTPTREAVLEWSRAHREFHFALFTPCGSYWLSKFISVLYDHSERYRMLANLGDRDTVAEHERIVDAIKERDPHAARDALRAHFRATVRHLEQLFPTSSDGLAM